MELLFQILLVFLLVGINAYFVASEFALVAVRKTRVEELVRKGSNRAKQLQRALLELDTYISATQLGITLASLALGWIGEPAIARLILPVFSFLPETSAAITSHTVALIISFSIITFLHIVLGELAPKSLALQKTETVSLYIITPLVWFSKIFRPAIWALNKTGQLVLKLSGLNPETSAHAVHSEEEIRMLLRQSSEGGAIPAKEVEISLNAFQLGDIPVKVIMVPRTDITAFRISSSLKDIIKRIEHHPHSRFPVYEQNIDTIMGFVHVKDIYREAINKGDSVRLSDLNIVRKIIIIPEVKKIDAVLQEMRRKRVHLAVVNDEYGGTAGIVSLEDILESLIGEIDDEFDEPERQIVRQKDGSFVIEGHTLIEDIQEKFHLPLKGQGYTTIGGLVFGLLGHEPRVDDQVQISNLMLEVRQIEGKRIKQLRLKKLNNKK